MKSVLNEIRDNQGLLIVFFTSYGYLCTYMFEYGFCEYHKIPTELISVEITNILRTIVFFIGAISSAVFILSNVVLVLQRTAQNRISKVFAFANVGLLFIYVFVYLYIGSNKFFLNWAISFVVINGILLGRYLDLRNDSNVLTAQPRYAGWYKIRIDNLKTRYLRYNFQKTVFNKTVKNVLIYGSFVAIAYIQKEKGISEANNENYYFVKNNSQLVLIKVYGNSYIFKNWVPGKKNFGDSLIFINSESTQIHLVRKKLFNHLPTKALQGPLPLLKHYSLSVL
jgi:hypothetical protein